MSCTVGPMNPGERAIALEDLEPVDFDLLTLVALAEEPVAKSGLSRLASARGVRPPGQRRALTKDEVEERLERLVAQELAVVASAEPHRYYTVVPTVAIDVLGLAQERGRLRDLREPSSPYGARWNRLDVTNARLALAGADRGALARILGASLMRPQDRAERGQWWVRVLGIEPRDRWLDMLPEEDRRVYLSTLLDAAPTLLPPLGDRILELAAAVVDPSHRLQLARSYVLRGESERARALTLPKGGQEGVEVLTAFWEGDYGRAAQLGDAAVEAMRKRKHRALPGLEGVSHVLATLSQCGSEPARIEHAGRLVESGLAIRSGFPGHYRLLQSIHDGLLPNARPPRAAVMHPAATEWSWSEVWVAVLHDLWLDVVDGWAREERQTWSERGVKLLTGWADHAAETGHRAVARELWATAAAISGTEPGAGPALVDRFRAPRPWEAALAGLEGVGRTGGGDAHARRGVPALPSMGVASVGRHCGGSPPGADFGSGQEGSQSVAGQARSPRGSGGGLGRRSEGSGRRGIRVGVRVGLPAGSGAPGPGSPGPGRASSRGGRGRQSGAGGARSAAHRDA